MSVKTIIKRTVKGCVSLIGAFLPVRSDSRILTYHSVGHRDHEMNVTPEDFRAQMKWISENCVIIPLADAAMGKPGIAITFDDGYRDNLINAAPILKEFGFTATVFVVTGKVGAMLEHDDDPETSALMTWEELRKWESIGLSVGGHTMTHKRLSQLTDQDQENEIRDCALNLEENLKNRIEAFAYPFGSALDFNDISKSLAKEAGFAYAVSNRYGPNNAASDRWNLRRIWIDNTDSISTLEDKVRGRLDPLALLDTGIGIRLRRFLNAILRIR